MSDFVICHLSRHPYRFWCVLAGQRDHHGLFSPSGGKGNWPYRQPVRHSIAYAHAAPHGDHLCRRHSHPGRHDLSTKLFDQFVGLPPIVPSCTCRANKLSSAQEADDIDERGRDPKYEDRPYDSVEAAVQEPMSSHRAPELTFHRSTPFVPCAAVRVPSPFSSDGELR